MLHDVGAILVEHTEHVVGQIVQRTIDDAGGNVVVSLSDSSRNVGLGIGVAVAEYGQADSLLEVVGVQKQRSAIGTVSWQVPSKWPSAPIFITSLSEGIS